jgi:hypothetical protein
MTVAASRIVGRKASGDIDDMTLAELVALGGTPDGTKFLKDDGTLATPPGSVSDTAYAGSWDGVTTVAPSKNAVYDKVEALAAAKQDASSDLTDLVARWVAASAAGPASLDFAEDTDNGSNKGTLTAPAALAADRTWTMPDASGTVALASLAGSFYTGATALTDTSPNSTSFQQWGSEEAVIAQAKCPTSAVVVAVVTGTMRAGPGTPAVLDRGVIEVQISFDGGSSFTTFGSTGLFTLVESVGSAYDVAVHCQGRATGTVTGDIQVRSRIRDVDQANDTTWRAGYITVTVHPQ